MLEPKANSGVMIVGAGYGGAYAAHVLKQGGFAGSIAIVAQEPEWVPSEALVMASARIPVEQLTDANRPLRDLDTQ